MKACLGQDACQGPTVENHWSMTACGEAFTTVTDRCGGGIYWKCQPVQPGKTLLLNTTCGIRCNPIKLNTQTPSPSTPSNRRTRVHRPTDIQSRWQRPTKQSGAVLMIRPKSEKCTEVCIHPHFFLTQTFIVFLLISLLWIYGHPGTEMKSRNASDRPLVQ